MPNPVDGITGQGGGGRSWADYVRSGDAKKTMDAYNQGPPSLADVFQTRIQEMQDAARRKGAMSTIHTYKLGDAPTAQKKLLGQ